MAVTFQYDLLIVLSLTIVLGYLLQKVVFSKQQYKSKLDRIFPFALAYFPTAIIYAFIADVLPLRCFSFDTILNAPGSSELGPQSVNGEGLLAVGIYFVTVIINISVWLFALVIIIRQFTKRKTESILSESRDNQSKSFLED